MKKIFTLAFAAVLSALTSHAQGTWNFAAPTDGAGGNSLAETGKGICTDAAGNVYMAGVFNANGGATDFDLNSLSTSTFSGTTNDGFIASYDKDGNFRWKTIISGTASDFQIYFTGTATNGTYVWVAGSAAMAGAPQILSSTNTVTLTSGTGLPASVDAMVAKLNCSNGAVQWATTFGGSGNNDFATGLAIDPNGCCYTLGAYSGAYTLGSVSAPALVGGSSDEYVAKLSAGGTLIHLMCGGSSGVDMQGNGGGICYVPGASPSIVGLGSFNYPSATFGSFTVTNSGNANNNDMLLLEMDTTLSVTNAIGMGTGTVNLGEELYGAVYDPFSGGVYVSGYFNGGTITVPGVGNLTSLGGEDIFIGRYSVSGNNFIWAHNAGAAGNERSYGITADGQGGIILCGESASSPSCQFGSVSAAVGNGANDIVVARYNNSGTAIWALSAGGTGGDDARGIASYVQTTPYVQNLYVTGNFQNSVTFGSTTLTADGASNNDFFLARIQDNSLPLTATQSHVNLTCNGVCTGSATVVASGGTAPYTYSWSPSGGSGATASSLCATNYTCTITDASSTSITKTFSITQPTAIVITPISQTNVSCFGGSNGAAQVSASGGTGTLTYNWTPGTPTGDGTGSVSGLTAQVYTITVTDANSCTATRTFNITQPASPVSGSTVVTNVACFGGNTGAINLTPTGGTPGYTFNWLPSGPTTEDRTNLVAGTYSVQITDANGCTGTVTATVTQPTSPVSGTTVVTNVACFGGNTGAINLTPTGGTGPYTFNWLPSGPTTEDRTSLVAGTYSVQITDANGCTGTVTATVTQPTSPVSGTTVVTNVACFGGNTGAINLTPTGGTGPYTFNWLPSGPTTEDRTSLVAGTYSVQITDANGCTGTVTATVTQPTSPVSGTTVVTNIACFGGNTGAINLTPTGGTGPYTFNWLPSGPTTEDRTSLVAGTYSVQITDANGCTGTVTATVTQPTSPVSGTTVVTNIACFGGNTGAINLTPTGGTGPYTFNWLPSGPTTEDRTNLVAGTYSVQITDVNGCTGTVTATVTQPTSPVSGTTVVTNVACFGGNTGAINLTPTGGTGPYTFNWLPSGPTTEDRTNLVAGTYSVQITDVNGCTGTVTATVTQPTSPVSGTTVVTNVACFGGNTGAINLTPTGGTGPYTFNWLPSGPTTEDRTNLVAGTYSVVITDVNGCTGTVTASVTQPTSPVSGTTVVTNIACFGGNTGAINLTPTGGTGPYTFNWLPSGPTTEDRTNLVAGTYSVVITDVNGCTGTVTASVTQPTSPVSGTTVVTNIACFGGNTGAINLTPTGGTGPYTFNWLPSGPTTEDRTNLVAGTYSVQITDVNGCTGTVTATVTQPTSPVSGTTVVTNVACFGGNTGAINLTPTGGTGPYTFNWLPSGPTTEDRTNLVAGTYSVVITDVNGCTGTVTASVTQPTSPVSGTTVVTNVSCFGGNTGAINLTPSGGTGPYTFNWLPSGPTTEDRTNLTQGTYTVIITDVNGCTGTVTANVTQPSAPVSGTTVVTNVACFGGNTGAINLTPSGGVGPYTFNWLPSGPTTEDRTNLTQGTYTVIITDANGCTGTVTANVTQPSAPVSGTTVVTNVACFGGNTGAINLTPSGGVGPYTFNWLPSGPTTEDRTNLTQGTYTVIITDVNGCTGTVTANVTQPSAPVSGTTVVTNVACFGGNTGAINLTPSGGVGPYTFNWLPSGPTTEDRTNLTQGTYTVIITDVNGCTGTVTANVTQPTAPVSGTTVVTNVSCFGGSNGAINLTPSGGVGPYTFNWGSAITTEDRTGLTQGSYTVIITDANSCTGTVMVSVTQPSSPVSGTTVVTNVSCFGGNTGAINLTPTGGTPGYTFNWLPSGPTTEDRTGLTQGTYSVQITDANGCTGTVTASVTQPTAITASIGSTTTLCTSNTGTATVSGVTGGTPGYTYDWTPGNPTGDGTTSISGLGVGTWSCLITDANGCTLTKTVNVTTPGSPTITLTSQTNILCNGGNNGAASVNASGAGVLTYDWTPGNPTGDGTNSVSNLTAGAYNVTVTDGNGCSTTLPVSITQPTPVVATATGTNISCNGDSTGTVTVAASGGTGTLSYSWSFGGTLPTESNLPANIYSCTVTDANGCTTTATVEITEPSALAVTHTVTDVNCFGGNDGSASVSVSGGVPGYLYNWAPGGYTTATVNGLDENMYLVDISDQNGCSITDTIFVNAPSMLVSTVTFTNVTCNSACNGTATANVSGGTAPYAYQWSGGQTTAAVNGLCPGTYTCNITDSHNCTSTFTVLITEPPVLTVTQMQTNVSCFGNATGDAMVMVSGGLGTYTYSWAPTGGNNATASNLLAGTYTCTISDGGCTVTATFNITEPSAPLSATTMQTNISCNGGNNGEAMVMVSGGTPGYTYAWSPNGGNAATASNLVADNYSCLITDANGCTLTETFTITEPAALANTFSVTDVNCFGNCNGSVVSNVTGGTAPYSYNWAPTGNTTANLTGLCAGCYTLTIIDANACMLTETVCITQPAQLLASVTSTTNPSTCGNTDGAIDITVTGGIPTYSFLWNNSATSEDLTGIGAGSYNVTITDGSGCTVTTGASINDPNAPTVSVTLGFDTACSNLPGAITLSGESPTGGTWSGTGVSGNQFDPFGNSVAPGMYMVTYTYTDVNGCTGSASDTVWAENCMGVNEVAVTNNWQLFPNPTSGQFTLNGEVESGSFSVEIFAVDGRLVYASQKEVSATVQTTTVDLGTEAAGIYFVKIRNNDHLTTMKVIRQ